jgi:hypothetical protein
MTGTIHQFPRSPSAGEGQQTEALPLPTHALAVDLILTAERLRVASSNLVAVLRCETHAPAATRALLNEILDTYLAAECAADALEAVISCKGQG